MKTIARPWKDTTLVGLFAFAFSLIIYWITAESTVAFWDCGEFIAAAALLQVPHAPGAPLYLLIARVFTLFASEPKQVAWLVTLVACISSAATIGVLASVIMKFIKTWSTDRLVVIGGGLVGSLAYAFSDSFWTSATEAEVYNMSNLFVVLILWAGLKFREGGRHQPRYVLLIAFLIGSAVGVHLLSLLTIPAVALIMFFRNDKVFWNTAIAAISLAVTLITYYLVIPSPLLISEQLEMWMVNQLQLPFFSGVTLVYSALLVGCLGLSLLFQRNRTIHLTLLAAFFILLGSSSYITVVLRASANVPMNEGAPDDSFALKDYWARAQFGGAPLIYGPQYTAEILVEDGKPVFEDGKPEIYGYEDEGYLTVTDNRFSEPVYDPAHHVFFPRMFSSSPQHVRAYQRWGNIPDSLDGPPTFAQNMRFFLRYQLGHQFFRYFLWNFSGRQNNFKGEGGPVDGNWITGIDAIDRERGVDSSTVILSQSDARTRSVFYGLPLLLGLIGLFIHFGKDGMGAYTILVLFAMTGIAMVLYLNQVPFQARERDYAYLGAYLSFAIWIGVGGSFLIQILINKFGKPGGITGLILALFIPAIMLANGWQLHNKSDRHIVRELALNYLNSCPENAILFTQGDNDTYPLWYLQHVEGIRRDVRVVNLSLLNTDWYLRQMESAQFDAAPIKFSVDQRHFRGRRLLYLPVMDENLPTMTVSQLLDFVVSEHDSTRYEGSNSMRDKLPTTELRLPLQNDSLAWNMNRSYVLKSNLAVLDIIRSNFPERPIAYASSCGPSARIGLGKYLNRTGMIYELTTKAGSNDVDVRNPSANAEFLMEEIQLGAFSNSTRIYDEDAIRMAWSYRSEMLETAQAFLAIGDTASTIQMLHFSLKNIPLTINPIDDLGSQMAAVYLDAEAEEKGTELLHQLLKQKLDQLQVITEMKPIIQAVVPNELEDILSQVESLFLQVKEHDLMSEFESEEARFKELGKVFLES